MTYGPARIWVYLWNLEQKRWGLRIGQKWLWVDFLSILIPCTGKFGKLNPRARLTTYGRVRITRRGGKLHGVVY